MAHLAPFQFLLSTSIVTVSIQLIVVQLDDVTSLALSLLCCTSQTAGSECNKGREVEALAQRKLQRDRKETIQ